MRAMTIDLTPEQHAWIQAHVASGDFPSVEEAARQLIDERIAERSAEEEIGDLAWARPYVDEALADVAEGKVLTLEEHEARMDAILALMQG
jgi:antitoxin ParD1/3/4